MNRKTLVFIFCFVLVGAIVAYRALYQSGSAQKQNQENDAATNFSSKSSGAGEESQNESQPQAQRSTASTSSPQIAEAAAAALEKKYATKVFVDQTHFGKPFAINGEFRLTSQSEFPSEPRIREFIGELSGVLNFSSAPQLGPVGVQETAAGTVSFFYQFHKEVPVEHAQIRLFFDPQNQVYLVKSTLLDGIESIDTTPKLTASEAEEIAYNDALMRLDPINKRKPTDKSQPKLVIKSNPQPSTDPSTAFLAWKIQVNLIWLGPNGVIDYYVNAHNGRFITLPGAIR
jgi:hypothetical protein